MDIIQLQDNQDGWKIYRFRTEQERQAEFDSRNIQIGENVNFGRYCMIGNYVRIGDNTSIGEECMVNHHAVIGKDATMGERTFIGAYSKIGENTCIADDAFVGRRTTVGNSVTMQDMAEVGDNVTIGEQVKLGLGAVVMDNSVLRDGTDIGQRTFIGNSCQTGFFVMIGLEAQLVRDVIVHDGTSIPEKARIAAFSTVTKETALKIQPEKEPERQTAFEQIATFTTIEGYRGIRGKKNGIWTNPERISEEDSRAYLEKKITLDALAEKYLTPRLPVQETYAGRGIGRGR